MSPLLSTVLLVKTVGSQYYVVPLVRGTGMCRLNSLLLKPKVLKSPWINHFIGLYVLGLHFFLNHTIIFVLKWDVHNVILSWNQMLILTGYFPMQPHMVLKSRLLLKNKCNALDNCDLGNKGEIRVDTSTHLLVFTMLYNNPNVLGFKSMMRVDLLLTHHFF